MVGASEAEDVGEERGSALREGGRAGESRGRGGDGAEDRSEGVCSEALAAGQFVRFPVVLLASPGSSEGRIVSAATWARENITYLEQYVSFHPTSRHLLQWAIFAANASLIPCHSRARAPPSSRPLLKPRRPRQPAQPARL